MLGSCFPASMAQSLALGNTRLGNSSARQVVLPTPSAVVPCRDRPSPDATISISTPTLESCLCSLAGRCHLHHRKGAPVRGLSRGWCAPAPPPAWAGNVLSVHRLRCAFWAGTFPPELLQRARDTTRQWISHGPLSLMSLSLSDPITSLAQGCLWLGLPGGLGASSSTLASCSCRQSMAWQRQRVGHPPC